MGVLCTFIDQGILAYDHDLVYKRYRLLYKCSPVRDILDRIPFLLRLPAKSKSR